MASEPAAPAIGQIADERSGAKNVGQAEVDHSQPITGKNYPKIRIKRRNNPKEAASVKRANSKATARLTLDQGQPRDNEPTDHEEQRDTPAGKHRKDIRRLVEVWIEGEPVRRQMPNDDKEDADPPQAIERGYPHPGTTDVQGRRHSWLRSSYPNTDEAAAQAR